MSQIRDKKAHRKHIATMNPINAKRGCVKIDTSSFFVFSRLPCSISLMPQSTLFFFHDGLHWAGKGVSGHKSRL
ncbi:hypothetical protein C3V43_13745 [Bacteroides heparinolyticus]|nr:hypothetical protein C3V43_13745 [Bacteroides heparinolyticus]